LQPSMAGFAVRPFLERHFHRAMALLMIAAVLCGFSFTIDANLIHAAVPRPFILCIHVIAFAAWLGTLTLQAALVRSRRIRLRRQIGRVGVALGCVVFVMGLATTGAMAIAIGEPAWFLAVVRAIGSGA
jgi:hypothetical protein